MALFISNISPPPTSLACLCTTCNYSTCFHHPTPGTHLSRYKSCVGSPLRPVIIQTSKARAPSMNSQSEAS